MERIWKVSEIPGDELRELEQKTGIPPILLKIIWNRGLRDVYSIERFFEPRSRYLPSPFLLEGIPEALKRLHQAFAAEEGIRVFGDRDVDGITSTIVLLETLRTFSRKVDFTVPVIEDGYGLNPDYIDTAKRDGVSLLVTVDCGISNIQEVEYARSQGIDVIITDHHEAPAQLPAACAIIDPKMPDSRYPFKDLAGVGVSLKLSLALVLSKSKDLPARLIACDYADHELDVVRFGAIEGWLPMKQITPQSFSGAKVLFWSRREQDATGEVLPFVKRLPDVMYISELAEKFFPGKNGLKKSDICKDLSVPPDISPGRQLIIMFLKFLEARDPHIQELWQRSLDALTIGTIADMVPMRGENRTVAQLGLRFITNTKRIGLSLLYQQLGWHKRTITEKDVSFGISPILNSSGRLKSAELAIELLTTTFSPKAEALAKELFELNSERKRLAEECYRQVRECLLNQVDPIADRIYLVHAPLPNQGVTGIVATRLMLEFCRPVFVVLEDHGRLLGSGRSCHGINLVNALNHCSEFLEKYGGHIGAAGVTLLPENINRFRARLREFSAQNVSDEEMQVQWCIDTPLDIDMVTDEFLNDILRFAPFGIENAPPLFLSEKVSYIEVKKVGETKNHLRFRFRKKNGQPVFGIGFGLGALMPSDSMTDGVCDIVYHIEPNDYNGVRSAQMLVVDVRFADRQAMR
jgi:single-stranded-DNA-specific exonuclease